MQDDATKVYSTRQERMVADYLGWETVPASGARDFTPGDVRSSRFLGECKTHVTKVPRIQIMFDVWAKLDAEAMSQMRIPVLFVDNGTQKEDNTWAVIPATFATTDKDITVGEIEVDCYKARASFYHAEMRQVLCGKAIGKFKYRKYEFAIMSLPTFKYLIEIGD